MIDCKVCRGWLARTMVTPMRTPYVGMACSAPETEKAVLAARLEKEREKYYSDHKDHLEKLLSQHLECLLL